LDVRDLRFCLASDMCPTGINLSDRNRTAQRVIRAALSVLLASVLVLSVPRPAVAQTPDLDRRLIAGQEAMYRLRYAEARRIFEEMRRENPDSPVAYGMLSILAFNELLFAAGNVVTEDYATPGPLTKERTSKPIEEPTRRFHAANDEMLRVCEKALAKNENDATALYFMGLYHENLATEAIAVTKSNGTAFDQGKKAVRIHTKVLRIQPDLVDANMSIAGSEFAKDNLPWWIRFLTYMIGMHGDEKRAFERLDLVARQGRYRRFDAQAVSGVLHAWKKDAKNARQAVAAFDRLRKQFPENYLLDINLAAIYEQTELNDGNSALKIYEELLGSLSTKTPGLKAGEVYYRIGKTHYRLKNYRDALAAFQKAVDSEKAEVETAPLAQFYMGKIHEEQGDRAGAARCYREVMKFDQLPSIAREVKHARSYL
jgi:tetratricopeptide (TPR) repeat protein